MAQNVRNLDDVHNGPRGGQVAEAAASTVDKAKEKVGEWSREAQETAGNVANRAQEMSAAAYDMVKDKTQELTSAAAHKAEEFGREVTSMVRRYPLQSLAASVALGFLLGKVIDLRRS